MKQDNDHNLLQTYLLEPRTGTSIVTKKDQIIRIIDVQGQQVVDLVSYSQQKPQEYLSSPRTVDFNNKIFFSTGDVLYSDRSNPMWTITGDKVGHHCFLFAPCNQKMFEITYGATKPHPNCFDNLSNSMAPFGIPPEQIFVPFNIFMNAGINQNGEITIHPPLSKPGDYIELQAEMDMIVGVSACSAYKSNDYSFSQIKLEIISS
jgi:uncharacterized protein YcgI (DUF1989 family)